LLFNKFKNKHLKNTPMKQFFTFLAAVVLTASTFAQVGIGTTIPNPSAALDITSTTQGFLPPRMTAAQRNSISNPSAGLMLWCSDCGANGELNVFNGSAFTAIDGSAAAVAAVFSSTQIGGDIDGEAASDNSGTSVSLSSDGAVVAIGAPGNDGNGNSSGHVRVYQNISGTWTKIGDDIDGEAASDNSGTSVSLSSDGTIVAIGARGNDGNGNSSGHVRVYQNISGTWTQLGGDIDGEAASDNSGTSVSLSSDGAVVAIGAPGNDGNGLSSGHVRVYQYTSPNWNQLGSDIDGEAANDNSGFSVSLSSDGTIVAIGAPQNVGTGSNAGHVRVYENISGTWTKIGDDIDGEAANDNSGASVSLSSDGTIVAIGAPGNGGSSGHVRVYQYTSPNWIQLGGDIDGEAASDYSGTSVSLSSDGTIVAIGAITNDDTASNSGHVRVYKNISGTWTQLGGDINGEAANDYLGKSVSLSGNGTIVAIGADSNDGNGPSSGHVRIYN
jgi:Flp pilus assembly pilin Flp